MARSSGPLSTTSAHMIAIRLKKTHRQIFGALLSLSSAALLIRVMGMVNQIIVTSRFGAGATMDAYFVASSLPTLLASLSGSAIEASVIPIYARVRTEGKEQASILVSTLLNIFLLAAVLVTIIMLIFRRQFIFLSAPALDPFRAGLAASLAPVIFPSLILLLIISLLECILNTEGQFGWPAYAGMLVPLTTAVFVLLLGKTNGVVILCVGTLVGLCLQVCAVFVRTRRAGLSYHFTVNLNNPALGAILIAAWPVFLGALISQASPLVDQIFASYLSAGSISALSYALKLIGVPTGVIFVAVGRAVLPYLSRQASANDMKAFKHTLRLYLWMVGGGTILLTCFMLVLAHPIVRILFQHGAFTAEDTDRTAVTLVGFVVGLTPMALGFITARAFSALGKTRVLMGVTMFSVVANAVFDYIFARFWQSAGIALSTSAVYFCTMFILFFILQRMIGDLKLLTPPQEVLDLASRIGLEEGYMRVVEWWNHGQGSLFGIPYRMRMQIIRLGMILAVFAVGIFGLVQNTLYTVRAALGSLIVLALLRYRYALLFIWVMLDVFVGSTVQFFQNNNIDTGLTVPTLLLLLYFPVKQTFQRVPALAFLLIYCAWVVLGIGISPLGLNAFMIGWLLLLDCVGVAVLAINVLTTERRLTLLIDAIHFVSSLLALYGIYGYLTKQNGVIDIATGLFRSGSIFGQVPPTFAFFLSLVIPLAIYRTFTLPGIKRAAGLLVTSLLLVALALTFTRATFISVGVSILILILCLPSARMKISMLGGILAVAIVAVLVSSLGDVPIFDRFLNSDVSTLNGRTYLWQAVIDHFDPTKILGNGSGAASALLASLHIGFGGGVIGAASHNLFLETLYDHGIIGLTLFLLLLAVLAVNLISGMLKASGRQRLLFATVLAIFVSAVIECIDSNDIWNQSISIYFWIIMVLPFALCWSTAKQPPEPIQEEGTWIDDDEATVPRIKAMQKQESAETVAQGVRTRHVVL